jgi:hypothetical protein
MLVRMLYTCHCAHFSKREAHLPFWHTRTTKKKLLFMPVICIGVRHSLTLREGRGRAVVKAISRWLPTAAARVRIRAGMWGLWCTKRHWGRFSPSTSVSLANHHSTNFSIIIITRGWHSRPIRGRSAEGTQFGLHPSLYQLKKGKGEGQGAEENILI